MFESEFKKLAEKEKCEYKVKNFVVDGSIGAKLPISIYTINLLYNDIDLEIRFELGNSNVAESKFQIIASKNLPNFKLVTRNHFSRLFFKREQIWKIVCNDSEFKKAVLSILNASGLNYVAPEDVYWEYHAGVGNIYVYIFLAAFVIWLLYRLLKGISVIFDVNAGGVYFYGLMSILILKIIFLLYYEVNNSVFQYLKLALKQFNIFG